MTLLRKWEDRPQAGRKYLQITPLTKDLCPEHVKNPKNSKITQPPVIYRDRGLTDSTLRWSRPHSTKHVRVCPASWSLGDCHWKHGFSCDVPNAERGRCRQTQSVGQQEPSVRWGHGAQRPRSSPAAPLLETSLRESRLAQVCTWLFMAPWS